MLTALNSSKLILLICVCFVEDILATTPEYDVTEFWNVSVTESPISIGNDGSIYEPKIPLYIAAFYANGEIWDGTGMIPAVELAVDHVNAQPNILRDYELRVIWKNSNVSLTKYHFFHFISFHFHSSHCQANYNLNL